MLWFLLKTLCTEAHVAQLCHINMTVKNSWNKSMTNMYEDKINTEDLHPVWVQLSADTLGKSKFGNISEQRKEGSFLKNWFHKYIKRGKQYHPAIKTLSSFMLHVCATPFVLPSFICHISSLSPYPCFSSFSLFLLLSFSISPSQLSSWQPLDLYKSEGRRGDRGVEVTVACASCLICLDHGYGAYLDNNAACQHLHHTHSHTHAALYLRMSNSVKQSICYNYTL